MEVKHPENIIASVRHALDAVQEALADMSIGHYTGPVHRLASSAALLHMTVSTLDRHLTLHVADAAKVWTDEDPF